MCHTPNVHLHWRLAEKMKHFWKCRGPYLLNRSMDLYRTKTNQMLKTSYIIWFHEKAVTMKFKFSCDMPNYSRLLTWCRWHRKYAPGVISSPGGSGLGVFSPPGGYSRSQFQGLGSAPRIKTPGMCWRFTPNVNLLIKPTPAHSVSLDVKIGGIKAGCHQPPLNNFQ